MELYLVKSIITVSPKNNIDTFVRFYRDTFCYADGHNQAVEKVETFLVSDDHVIQQYRDSEYFITSVSEIVVNDKNEPEHNEYEAFCYNNVAASC